MGRGLPTGRQPSREEVERCEERERRKGSIQGWTDWLSPVGWALQLHMNCREPLGEGSWLFVLRQVVAELERRTGAGVVAFGVTQPNRDRSRQHLHALLAAQPQGLLLSTARQALLDVPRWKAGGIGHWIEQLLTDVQPVWRPFVQVSNAGSVTMKPVTPRGGMDDPRSLVRYVVRYLLRVDEGAWLEVGNLSTVLNMEGAA